MKYLFVCIVFATLASGALATETDFTYETESLPIGLLKKWIPEYPLDYRGEYEGECGDTQGRLIIIAYLVNEGSQKPDVRFSGCLIGSAVTMRPRIRVFENAPIFNGVLKTKHFTGCYMMFKHPDSGKQIKGILIGNLFFEERK